MDSTPSANTLIESNIYIEIRKRRRQAGPSAPGEALPESCARDCSHKAETESGSVYESPARISGRASLACMRAGEIPTDGSTASSEHESTHQIDVCCAR
jgi:hypothetical protein